MTLNPIVGGFYNWKHQPERLIYLGIAISNGPWLQFSLISNPTKVWCEVRRIDLQYFEETAQNKEEV